MRAWLNRIDHRDRDLVVACHALRRPWLTIALKIVTYSGSAPIWVGTAGVLLAMRFRGTGTDLTNGFLLSMLAPFIAWAIGNLLIRPVVRRPRPFLAVPGHTALVWVPAGGSMPSTHAATSVALFVALACVGHPLAMVAGGWSLLIVLSRLYLGVHYPSDLLVGGALGAVVAGVAAIVAG